MKYRPFLLAPLAALVTGFAVADTVTLRDGTTLEGEVLRETEDSIVVNVEIREGLREEQTFSKDDVLKIHETTVDEATFEEKIKGLLPTGNRMSLAEYERQIDGVVKPFLNAFPKSKHRQETEEILKVLEEEKAKVDAGGIKLGGEWLTKEQRDTNAFEIDAHILAHDMLALAEEGKYTQALRKFDELQAEYAATSVFVESLPAVLKVLAEYEARIKADLAQVDSRIEQREKAFATLNAIQRKAAEEDVERRAAAYERRIEFERKKKFRWLTLDAYHERPMENTLRQISSLRQRLEKFDPERIKPAGETYRQAWVAAGRARRSKTEDLVREMKRSRVPKQYLESIMAHLAAAEEAGVVYEEEETAETEDAATEEPEEAAPEEEEKPKKKSSASEERESDRSVATDDEEEESGSAMKFILFGIMGVVIIVGLVAAFAGKKKK